MSKSRPNLARGLAPTQRELEALKLGVESVLDPLADAVPGGLIVLSGYRNLALNTALGGHPNSDHLRGAAVDIAGRRRLAPFIFARTIELLLPYRQLIWYVQKKFLHVSWNIPGKPYKHEMLVR